MSKEYKAIKNFIHNELGLTKEDIIKEIRPLIKQMTERCFNNTYGNDNNIQGWIRCMVKDEINNRHYNLVPKMVEKVLREEMLGNLEIIVRNKNIKD